ncbi:MAG: thioredoxin family protein [Lentisphaeria bacterium]|nr:thioredoxin family protein [Lentisphaeria bacterium]MBQ7396261.1 thioredoxin family protein [Lentisphaeria bacterium]MBR7120578.1 thioredoxin family protein [Lentisphaeria bacterium]
MEILHLNKESFDKLTNQSEKAVLIDFWAEWCGPCKRLSPELEKLAAAHPDLIIGKIDVSGTNGELINIAVSLGVDTIPALFYYKDGKLAKKLLGYMTSSEIEEKLSL